MRPPQPTDLEHIKRQMHDVELHEVYVVNHERKTRYESEHVATVDTQTEKVLGIFNEDYHLVKHQEFLDAIKEVVGENFQGNYWCSDTKLYVYYYPDDWNVEIPERPEENLWFGVRFSNSYDGTAAIKCTLVAVRVQCWNGMYTEELLEQEYRKHSKAFNLETFKENVEEMLELGLDEVLEKLKKSMDMEAKTGDAVEVLRLPQSLKDVVTDELESRETLWNIYNKLTYNITHGYTEDDEGNAITSEDYSESYLQRMHRQASRLLEIEEDRDYVVVEPQ